MNRAKNILLSLALLLLGFTMSHAGVSFSINAGSAGYQPVGDYDYLPYGYQNSPGYAPPAINFHDMMSQYGVWVSVAPFGQVWKPYASNGWRPYTQGHWISTQQYGQTWEGYEPWAWAGYHYGNWIYDQNQGWVWIPGYDWHPGQVSWARGSDSIGWMPTPPSGYDYSRGYLSNVGPTNQFGYNDNNFGADYGNGNYNQGGLYNDPRYQSMYYNPAYNNISGNLWFFIGNSHYGNDNYANYSMGPDYTRRIFDQRTVRISNRQIDHTILERIVGQKIQVTPVEVREMQADKRNIRVVVPTGAEDMDRIRRNSQEVVRTVIAPGFAEKQKAFKGQDSKNKVVISRIFQQENQNQKQKEVVTQKELEARKQNDAVNQKTHDAQLQNEVSLQKQHDAQLQNEALKKQHDAQLQNEALKKQHDAQLQNEALKKQHDAQLQNEALKKQHDAQLQNEALKKQHDAQLQNEALKKQHDAQLQNEALKKQHDAQLQNEALKKQHDAQLQNESQHQDQVNAAGHGSEVVAPVKTPDSKDKQPKPKHKKKPPPPPPTQQ